MLGAAQRSFGRTPEPATSRVSDTRRGKQSTQPYPGLKLAVVPADDAAVICKKCQLDKAFERQVGKYNVFNGADLVQGRWTDGR